MYHSISHGSGCPEWPWSVSLRRFSEQMDLLNREGWAITTMKELVYKPGIWTGRTAVITFDDGYIDNLLAVEELNRRDMRATWFIVSGSLGQKPSWSADGRPEGSLLSATDLRDMQTGGMEIGSHTMHHARLTELDDKHMISELSDSKSSLEDVLGREITSFAYPYGAWDRRCASAVRECGYRAACTTRTGWALRDDDPFLLRRLTVFNTDTKESLARKLYFGSNDVSWKALSRYACRRIVSRLCKQVP